MNRAFDWARSQWKVALSRRAETPPLARPRRPSLPSIRRSWFWGWWSARLAAASGIGLEEYLRHRLSRYLSALPVSPDRLPVAIAIEDGGVVSASAREPSGERAAWLDTWLRSEGPAALQTDIQLAQGEVARLAGVLEEKQARVAEAAREVESAAREPAVFESDGGAETLGRPAVPPPWSAALHLFALALLLAQAWQLAIPVLEAGGVRTADLPGELQRNPAGVVLGALFALGASVSLFYFADFALRRAAELFRALPAERRRAWSALAGLAALGFAAAVSWAIAGTKPGPQRVDAGYAHFTLFLLALALPLTTSCLLQLGRRLQARREEALRAAVEWDQVHFRALSGWTRRAAALAAAERELARVEASRADAVARLRTLRARALLAERWAAEAAAEEQLELERLCHAVTSSLELDRYELLRMGGDRGRQRAQAPHRDSGRSLGLAG